MPHFTYKGHEYTYEIVRTDRKTLGIGVHPDLRIEVRAPHDTEEKAITERVHQRRRWIVRQWRSFLAYHPLPGKPFYKSGATHVYLGRQYRLRIEEGQRNEVKLLGGWLELKHHPGSTPERALRAWYRERTDRWFPKLLEEVYPRFRTYDIPKPNIEHRWMRNRWGSCKVSDRRILLNTELILRPRVGIEYVIAHELTHLLHPHHTRAFYETLGRVLPDWEKSKQRLEGNRL